MLSSAMSPFLDAELAARQERLHAGEPHATLPRRRSRPAPSRRSVRALAHRLHPSN